MDLSYSDSLIRIPDLSSTAPDLEILRLKNCAILHDIPSSLEKLSKLIELDLSGCYSVRHCPEIPCNIRTLKLDGNGIEHLPSSIEHLSQLVEFSLKWCTRLVSIPNSIGELKCLEEIHLNGCSNLQSLPESIKKLSKLKQLDLSGCERPKCIPELPSCLKDLVASGCTSLEYASTSFILLEKEGVQRLLFAGCDKLDEKVTEDVFKAHLLG
ncbi:disease resistance protein TAO1-like [Hevea brasiliensis]|uniref:disease resistance protein TAO1-like n=1 Tax=Hevea brasiliensis TaxID=3981 RepID=UPI0025FD5C49|nr:disease resistance protein TAO1-like [Hevea brasiliensis]